jgi:membrane-associated protein
MHDIIQFLMNPESLKGFIDRYENWTYLILFLVVFCETGLVVLPVLPGDTLLFAAGALAATAAPDGQRVLNIVLLMPLLALASSLGDTVNYWIGRWVGPKVFHKDHARFLDKENLHRAHLFYARHGGKTVFVARFIPLIRCFAPFVAGVGTMPYIRFITYSLLGSAAWMVTFVLGGYFLGRRKFVQDNFVLGCVAFSLIGFVTIVSSIVRQIRKARAAARGAGRPAAGQG